MPDSHALLHDLLRTPSPTGHETALQELIAERFRGIAERRETDLHGNLFLGVNTGAERAVMLAAHCDQIGFMIKHVDRNGYLFVDHLGGVDEAIVAGERVIVHGARGPVAGVFGKKATHLQSTSEREEVPRHSEVWIDIGVKDREEAEGHVRVGDYVTFEPRLTPLRNGRIAAPGLDDKAGLFAVLEALRLCAERDLSVALWVV
ncbi:MAG TPA: hypothetical protein VD963_03165, partial [Phycisphaerales bacterium]|nr:hypothetical protein [Phycisphaerales bacterium]